MAEYGLSNISKLENKHRSHAYGRSSSNSKHESRKHGHSVQDDRTIKKPGGLGWSTRNRDQRDDNSRNERLLSPPYINVETEGLRLAISPDAYEEVYEETKPKVKQDEKPKEAKDKSQSVRARPERYYELSPLMTTMVEAELKNIMIKVWHTLPDDAADEAEKLVIEKLKNTAGDDLRNTIGLNVTKRLLNVNNGILVKVKIHSEPIDQFDINNFAKKYGISDFKYVQSRTYAGRMKSWTDLDELYSIKSLKCGESRVTVTPVYEFMKCPVRLRTIFDGNQDYSYAKKIEKETAKKMKKPERKAIVTAEQVLAQEAKKSIAKTDVSKEKEPDSNPKIEVKAEQNKTESAKKSKTEEAKNIIASKTTVEPKAADKTPTPTKPSETSINKEIITSKQNEIKTETKSNKAELTKTPVNKAEVTIKTPKKEISSPKLNITKTPVAKTVQVETTKAPAKEPAKPIANEASAADPAEKEIVKQKTKEENKPDVRATKPQPTNTNKPHKIVAKESVETVAKEPAKIVAKKSVKMVANESVETVTKKQAKTVAKEPVQTVAKESAKTVVTTNAPKNEIAIAKLTVVKKTETKKTAPKVLPTKTAAKIAPKATVENLNKRTKVDKNDFDELNDHDILAMLSSGIVLDECSGSDID